MDSCLEGHVSNSDGSELIRLASCFLRYEARDKLCKKSQKWQKQLALEIQGIAAAAFQWHGNKYTP
jgi:hypothetical protein